MVPVSNTAPQIGATPPSPPSDTAHVLANISTTNGGVIVEGFAKNSAVSTDEFAVIQAIKKTCLKERERRCGPRPSDSLTARAVLIFVSQDCRAEYLFKMLTNDSDIRVRIAQYPLSTSSIGDSQADYSHGEIPVVNENRTLQAPGAKTDMLAGSDIIIIHRSLALDLFRTGNIFISSVSLFVFDEAEKASIKAHGYSCIIREFYRGIPASERPPVLAIATVREDLLLTATVEENLFVKFPSNIGTSPCGQYRHTFGEGNGILADVEHIYYSQDKPERSAGSSSTAQFSDYEVVVDELGSHGVNCYQRMLVMKHSLSSGTFDASRIMKNKMDQVLLAACTQKARNLLHFLQKVYEASTDTDKLMVTLHAGRPAVAVALHAIISGLEVFDGMVTRVILGDEKAAKFLQPVPFLGELEHGFQDAEADNEAIDAFGSGVANVLIVASSNIDRIQRQRRKLPSSPLVIRFDGSLVDPDEDGGGGHCRVVVFKRERIASKPSNREGRKRKRFADAPTDVQRAVRNGEDVAVTAMRAKKEGVSSAKPYADAVTKPVEIPASAPPAVVAPEPGHISKKLKRPSHSKKERKEAATSSEKAKEHSEHPTDKFVHRVHTAKALIQPQTNGAEECYLYGMRLEHTADKIGAGANAREMSNVGRIECFGVILAQKLNTRDMSVSIGDLSLQCFPDKEVGTLRLVFLGTITISSKQLEQIRLFMARVFSIVVKNMSSDRFVWGKHLENAALQSDIPCNITHLRNYLVVPVLTQPYDNERNLAEPSDTVPPHSHLGEVPVRGKIDWDLISAVITCSTELMSKTDIQQIKFPEPGLQLANHMATLERNLVYMASGSRVFLAGNLRRDESPSTEIPHSKKFFLEKDGSMKWDKDIKHLINVNEVPDEKGPSPYFTKAGASSERYASDLGAEATEKEKEIRAIKISKPQKFSAARNREKNRSCWAGHILTTPAALHKNWHNIDIQDPNQPMLPVIRPPHLRMDQFLRVSRGESPTAVIGSIVKSAHRTESVIPELFRVHPLPVTALFLPASLMALERHVLLCELRDKISAHVDAPLHLNLLTQAVTAEQVNPSSNYERLELLGDAVLKIASTLRVFTNYPHFTEGQMHDKRAQIISNKLLTQMAKKFGLMKFLWFEAEKLKDWTPPGCDREARVVYTTPKALADVVEAICGALYLCGSEDFLCRRGNAARKAPERAGVHESLLSFSAVERGYATGTRALEMFGILSGSKPSQDEILSSALCSMHTKGFRPPREITAEAFPRDPRLIHPHQSWKSEYGRLEDIIGYRFKHRHLLMCALTHKSYTDSRFDFRMMSNSFQRLEFLGDAVLDFITIVYLYVTYPTLKPGELTQLKGMVVSNETWSRVIVKSGLHRYLFLKDKRLQRLIHRFEATVLKEIQEGDGMLHLDQAGSTAAPKALGDMFEAIIGAVLVDSGMEAAWNVSMKLLREVLKDWANPANDVAHPSRDFEVLVMQTLQITQTHPCYEHFKSDDRDNKFQCAVKVVGETIAVGKATSKQRAKMLAARQGHERLQNAKPRSPDVKLIDELREKARKISEEFSRNIQ